MSSEAPKEAPKIDPLVAAIKELSEKDKPKPVPKFGPAPTTDDGKTIKPNCVFHERDGKEYEAVVQTNDAGEPISKTIEITHKLGDDKWEKELRKTYDLQVNFKTKKADNWKPVSGVCEHSSLRNTYNKRWVILKKG